MVTFEYGNTSITIEDPDFPLDAGYKPDQQIIETEAGSRYVYTYKKARKKIKLKWDFLEVSDFSQLEDFVVNVVNFAENPFTYTDYEGSSISVRCTGFSFQQTNPDYYSVSLTLEEEL